MQHVLWRQSNPQPESPCPNSQTNQNDLAGLSPDLVAFNAIIDSFARRGLAVASGMRWSFVGAINIRTYRESERAKKKSMLRYSFVCTSSVSSLVSLVSLVS